MKLTLHFNNINEENIEVLVKIFYTDVLKDTLLSPFFIEKLGEDIESKLWKEHLHTLNDFWKFVALGYDEYTGSPLQPHFSIQGINRVSFLRWLELFHATVDSLYQPSIGIYFKEKSSDIAGNFMRRLNLKNL